MKTYILLILTVLPCAATTRYIAQTAGTFSGGTNCNGHTAITPATWNSTAESPGDISYVCGTITGGVGASIFTFGWSGTSGNPIQFIFDAGAVVTAPSFSTSGVFQATGQSWFVIDGGANGLVTTTLNGSAGAMCTGGTCTTQTDSIGFHIISGTNYTIQNLTVGPIYLRVNTESTSGGGTAMYLDNQSNSGASNVLIQNTTIHDSSTLVFYFYGSSDSGIEFSHDHLYNFSGGIIPGQGPGSGSLSGIKVHDSEFNDWSNWDDQTIGFNNHHDSIHIYGGGNLTNCYVWNNYFHGSFGFGTTPGLYLDNTGTGNYVCNAWNNLFNVIQSGAGGDGGFTAQNEGGTPVTLNAYNNTIIGTGNFPAGVEYEGSGAGGVLENNIITSWDLGLYINSGSLPSTSNYNDFFGLGSALFQDGGTQYTTLSAWRTATSLDANSISAAPNLNATTFVPNSGSPVIAAGVNLTSLCTGVMVTLCTDKSGTARPTSGAWDVGAFQSASSPGITITSPTNLQIVQSVAPLPLTVALTNAASARYVNYSIDGQQWCTQTNADSHPIIQDYRDAWTGVPFGCFWYPGLAGDGTHVVSACVYTSLNALLGTCATQTFDVRIEGLEVACFNQLPGNMSTTGCPTSPFTTVTGSGTFGYLSPDGKMTGTQLYLDGFPVPSEPICGGNSGTTQAGGSIHGTFNSPCWMPNGLHQIMSGYQTSGIFDPYLPTGTISSVSGTTLTFSTPTHGQPHFGVTGNVVTFQTTGTLPSPLIPGTQCFWRTSPTSTCTVTASISGSTMTITTSAALSVPTNTPVYIRNVGVTNQATGQPGCEGLFTATAISSTQFSVSLPSTCPNGTVTAGSNTNPVQLTLGGSLPTSGDKVVFSGFTGNWVSLNGTHTLGQISAGVYTIGGIDTTTAGPVTGSPIYEPLRAATQNLESYTNPYFSVYSGTPTQLSVSATCSAPNQFGICIPGSLVSLSGGSGTNTATFRIRSPWWTGDPNNGAFVPGWDLAATGGVANVVQLVDFENTNAPMELEPKFWEMHLVAGAGATADCNVGALVKNADLTTATACSAGTWTATSPGGGASSVCSVDGSGNVTPLTAGWCNVTVACTACAAGGASLPQTTTYVQVQSGSTTFPHFTRAGTLATSFTPNASFYPLSEWQLDTTFGTTFHGAAFQQGWLAQLMQQSNINSSLVAFGPGQGPGTTGTQTSCPNYASGQAINAAESFALANGFTMEFDAASIWFQGNDSTAPITALAAILSNIEYNRQACVNTLITHITNIGAYWRFYHDDEFTDELGGVLRPAPTIGTGNLTSITVSGGVATFAFSPGITGPLSVWSQTTGAGNWFQIVNATNTCLNAWYPSLSITNLSGNTSVITAIGSTSTCTNGTYAASGGTITETSAKIVLNPSALAGSANSQQNVSALPGAPGYSQQGFTHVYSGLGGGVPACASGGGCANTSSSALSSIVCASSTCTINWANHGVVLGQAIRIFTTGTTNLNIVAPAANITPNVSFTISYPGTSGQASPANGTYTASSNGGIDAGLVITIDPNWGPDPVGQYEALVNAVPNHPINGWSMSGGFFSNGSSVPTLVSYQGNPTNTDSAFDYNGTGPLQPYGFDSTVWAIAHYSGCNQGSPDPCTQGSGWGTRYLQLRPRVMLTGFGFMGGENTVNYCQSFNFNPACDRPTQLAWRPETVVTFVIGAKAVGASAIRQYNFAQNMSTLYTKQCCGWQVAPTGTGAGANPWNDPKQWAAQARTFAEITLDTRWELQPEGNKPYYGPFFLTDVHTSATYGNQFQIMCASEGLYPAFSVPTGAISGGTLMERILTPYSLVTTIVSGNPSTVSDGWCNNPNNSALSSPGRVTTFIALPPGVSIMDSQTFTPPFPLPYSATKWIIHDGPYINDLLQERATDCTSGCTISFDRHNINWYYRADYSDSNGLPGPGMGTVVMIPSQGSF